jgi:hypothetical protein
MGGADVIWGFRVRYFVSLAVVMLALQRLLLPNEQFRRLLRSGKSLKSLFELNHSILA